MIEVVQYAQADAQRWDAFCATAVNGTLLHTRRFLSYHGSRFRDESLLILDDGAIAGVLPAARSSADPAVVISHPGATYGGIVHQGRLRGSRMIECLQACLAHYRARGCRALQYKPVPHIYHARPAQDDLYALFRAGARRVRCDLSSTVDLQARGPVAERRRRGLKKARGAVQLTGSAEHLAALWPVLEANLRRKHGASPVHSLAEITELASRFPEQILLRCASIGGSVEAGVVVFRSPTVWHAQYIAASEAANAVSALDAVFEGAIQDAAQAGARFFDFGTSNEQAGTILNDGLYSFKTEFGGGGVAYEHYEMGLVP